MIVVSFEFIFMMLIFNIEKQIKNVANS